MTTFNTGNPIGSTDARDLSDNAENFDVALGTLSPTWVDRLGNTRDSFEGRLAKGSFYRVGTFAAGYTLTNMRQTLEYGNVEYSWSGSFPKVVAAGSTPTPVSEGNWVDRSGDTLKQLLSATNGDELVTHTQIGSSTNRSVATKLNKYSSDEDYGATKTEYGYNPTIDAGIVTNSAQDEDFLLPRHIGVAKDLFGIRRNACVFSARANSKSEGFNTQVSGVTTTQGLADYGSIDNVTGFFDIISTPYSAWEIVDSPTYYADGFSAVGLDFSGVKKGMVLRTLHATPYYGIVTSVSGTRIYIAEWRKVGSTTGETPAAGSGLRINPVDKLWALNCNVELPFGSRTQNAAVAEFGLANSNDAAAGSLNMFDLLILPNSQYGVTSGYFAHSGSTYSAKFIACYRGRNSDVTGACFLADSDNYRGFWAVNATLGYVYSTDNPSANAFSFCVKANNNPLDPTSLMAIDGLGRAVRAPDRVGIASNGVALTLGAKRWLNGTASAVSTALPTDSSLQDGDVIKLHCTSPASGLWTVTAASILPHGGNAVVTSMVLTEGVYEAVYIGGTWYINK